MGELTWQQVLSAGAAGATALAVYLGTINNPSETVEAISIVTGGVAVVLNAVNIALSTPMRVAMQAAKGYPNKARIALARVGELGVGGEPL